jgi:L-aminopeptidase/D-esterase-like protein
VTAIDGLRIGHADIHAAKTGVTVFLPDAPAVAAVHIGGAAPASREIDLLRPGNLVERVDAVVLSGGSAFGLAAADGVMHWLAARGRGYAVGSSRVPIVPAASLFDLANGGEKTRLRTEGLSIYPALGAAACEAAIVAPADGSVGAGIGATTADLKGGFGSATAELPGGGRVAAYAAVNSVGRVTIGASPHFRAAPFEINREFGGLGLPSPLPSDAADVVTKRPIGAQASTTLAVVATDYVLSRVQAQRVAIAAHDGIALAVYPAHTPFDGDMVFALSIGSRALQHPLGLLELCAAATAALARAIARAVFAAIPAPGDRHPTWKERYGS